MTDSPRHFRGLSTAARLTSAVRRLHDRVPASALSAKRQTASVVREGVRHVESAIDFVRGKHNYSVAPDLSVPFSSSLRITSLSNGMSVRGGSEVVINGKVAEAQHTYVYVLNRLSGEKEWEVDKTCLSSPDSWALYYSCSARRRYTYNHGVYRLEIVAIESATPLEELLPPLSSDGVRLLGTVSSDQLATQQLRRTDGYIVEVHSDK